MIRVLHLLGRAERELGYEARQCLSVVRERLGPSFAHETLVSGAWPLWASIRLRRALDRFDVIHAWAGRAFTAAMLAGGNRVVCSTPAAADATWLRQVNRAIGRREVDVVCATAARRRAIVRGGVPPAQCHLVRPPVDPVISNSSSRPEIRKRLGLRAQDYVLLAPGESTREANHELAVWAASILHVVDERYRILLWGRGPRLNRAAGLGQKLRQEGLVVVAEWALRREVDFSEIVAAADAVLVTARESIPLLPPATAMATGVPVVAAGMSELSEIVTDRETGLVVAADAASARSLAQGVLELRGDPQLATALGGRGRARALELFSVDQFVRDMCAVYERVAARRAHAAPVAT
jgi:glycosyltransferase involved in cell wall biosynthesis